MVACFHDAAATWGFPASLLTDNGAILTAASRNGRCALETELDTLGIAFKYSRPYHPQTCGKVERFHQTLKRFLAKQPPAHTIAALQDHLDRFASTYNTIRPHRALGRQPPAQVYAARLKAGPSRPGFAIPTPTGSATTRSTAAAWSRSGTAAACTTSASAEHTRTSES